MNLKPRMVQLGLLPDGGLGLLYEDGQPVPPQTSLPITAGKLNELLTGWIAVAGRVNRAVGVEEGVRSVAGPQYEAGIKAGAQATAGPVYDAAVKAGAVAGVKAGAEWALKNSVVHKRIERNDKGDITGIVEQRVPMEQPDAAQ